MEPKEKAIELIDKMSFETHKYNAISCALIAVNELIYSHSQDATDNQFYYWQEVKQEIEKL